VNLVMKATKSLLILLITLLGFCSIALANPCSQGIGGTGNSADPEGLGGTGITAGTEGLGGTGITAGTEGFGGTGIVGIITGFGSVCVNGIEAHFSSNTQVDIDGTPSSIEKLNKGEIVSIDAHGIGPEVMANHISVMHAVVGKIEAIDRKKNQIQIMNLTIQLNPHTQNANRLGLNQTIAVSGYFDGTKIHASRTDAVNTNDPNMVSGMPIDGKILNIPVTALPSTAVGMVQVIGIWDGKSLRVKDTKSSAIEQNVKQRSNFSVQTLVNSNTKVVNILGKQIPLEKGQATTKNNLTENNLATISGSIDKSGQVKIDQIKYESIEKLLDKGRGSPSLIHEKIKLNADEKSKESRLRHSEDRTPETDRAKAKHIEKTEKTEKIERVEKIEKVEKVEKIEKVDRVEKPELPEKIEIEKPELPEKIEIEKPETYTN
jgi:hypothetical protein